LYFLAFAERSREGRKGIPTSGISTGGPNLGVAFLDEERIAVIDGEVSFE
jgi:hypothetical protein